MRYLSEEFMRVGVITENSTVSTSLVVTSGFLEYNRLFVVLVDIGLNEIYAVFMGNT